MKQKIIFMLLVVLVLLAACSKEDEKAKDSESKGNGLEENANGQGISPLTGITANGDTEDRVVGVMVNNHPAARPQSGLSKADIVFEILAEGKITRFLALFQSEKPDVVGPVRSAREYYFELANDYDALYVYHGAANFVDDMIADRGIEHLNGALHDNDGNLFKRESFRKAPHNSYLQFASVYNEAQSKGYDITRNYEPLPFLEKDEKITGDPANEVQIIYADNGQNTVTFDYDKENETYSRFNGQEQTVELDSEAPIQVANVFIVEADHEVIDKAGRRAVDLTSGGDAYLIQKGKIQHVQWENKQGRIVPVKDGQVTGFVPGKTWVNVVPSDPGMKQSVNIK